MLEHRVTFRHGHGSESAGFIDLYHRGAFVLEAKKLRKADGKGFDVAMLRARSETGLFSANNLKHWFVNFIAPRR